MRLYIAGPMSGIEDWNFPKFNHVASLLRSRGYEVFNPAETDHGDTSKSWDYYLRKDIAELTKCQGIVLLDGWQYSKGALTEAIIALSLGLELYSWCEVEGRLREAKAVHGMVYSNIGVILDD